MIPIASLKKFLSLQFIARVEVSNMARCSSKTNELRNINSITFRAQLASLDTLFLESWAGSWRSFGDTLVPNPLMSQFVTAHRVSAMDGVFFRGRYISC